MVFKVGLAGALLVGCAPTRMPSPKVAAQRYSEAVNEGDVDVLFRMLTERARTHLSREELRLLLQRDRRELTARIAKLRHGTVEGQAALFLKDGRRVSLTLESGRFRVVSAGVLPRRPLSPEEAARELRAALLSRDYARLRALLTETGRRKFDAVFESLDESLSDLDSAIVEVRGDRAVVELVAGERIVLRKEGAFWAVEEIE